MSLDEGDNEPTRFLQNFSAAVQKTIPTIHLDWLEPLQGMEPGLRVTWLPVLINEISERAAPLVLVLDDFHFIRAQAILEILASLLDHMPPQTHLVILSRTDPPLPLIRLRARDQLIEIRAR